MRQNSTKAPIAARGASVLPAYDAVVFDARTVGPDEDAELLASIRWAHAEVRRDA